MLASSDSLLSRKYIHLVVSSLILLIGFLSTSYGQGNFQSGSTGADGAFNPSSSQTLTLPANGVFNFTTVNIPSGVTITFAKNASNTPVTILASGDVVISGTISLAGQPGKANGLAGDGGPGGFGGGNGGFPVPGLLNGLNGSGPGGGQGGKSLNATVGNGGSAGYVTAGISGNGNLSGPADGLGGSTYGNGLLIPLIGGSGGGGNASNGTSPGFSGGGGGGAIVIASSTTITLSSTALITVKGGDQSNNGGGSGGSVRLIANTISGNGTLGAGGGKSGSGFPTGSSGIARAEAFNLTNFTPQVPGFAPTVVLGTPNPVQVTNAPTLRIVSVAGQAAPSSPLGNLSGAADISLPSSQANPVAVVLEATNLPTTAVVFSDIRVTPSTGASTSFVSTTFTPSGNPSTFTATASVSIPSGISVINASITIDLTLAKLQPMKIDGEDIDKIEVTAVYGSNSELTYITKSGRRISGEPK